MRNTLDDIIIRRRSTRRFGDLVPDKTPVGEIVAAAVYAPYGGATGIPLEELRKIYVFRKGTPAWEELNSIMDRQMRRNSRRLHLAVTLVPPLKKKMGAFARKVGKFAREGIPAMRQAPYIIVVAEKKGFPPVEKQSLAHAMQNIWLAATDRGLGFQLISAIGTLAGNREFAKLIGLSRGEYAVEGCATGYPAGSPGDHTPKDAGLFVTWM